MLTINQCLNCKWCKPTKSPSKLKDGIKVNSASTEPTYNCRLRNIEVLYDDKCSEYNPKINVDII